MKTNDVLAPAVRAQQRVQRASDRRESVANGGLASGWEHKPQRDYSSCRQISEELKCTVFEGGAIIVVDTESLFTEIPAGSEWEGWQTPLFPLVREL